MGPRGPPCVSPRQLRRLKGENLILGEMSRKRRNGSQLAAKHTEGFWLGMTVQRLECEDTYR
jgi:hypothetical protein